MNGETTTTTVSRDLYANVTRSDGPYKATPPKPRKTPSSPFGPNPVVPGGKNVEKVSGLSFFSHQLIAAQSPESRYSYIHIIRIVWKESMMLLRKQSTIKIKPVLLSQSPGTCPIFSRFCFAPSKSELTSHSRR